jgi:hypothetical protein
MSRKLLIALLSIWGIISGLMLFLFIAVAHADEAGQRYTMGMSMSLVGQLLDLNAPICIPAAGSYSVQYRNSIATGCTLRASDDFATLQFTGGSAATYTMPQSKVSTFTGSISTTTLTTPANAVVIGSVITGVGVLDNTYVTAGSGTSWTVNNSQTVGSETLTQAVYPPGHGTCFKNNGTALLTIAATTSTIYGAAGVVNGNPAVTGGQVVLFPQGEACLQADPSNNYMVSGFLPGAWYQGSTSASSFQWTGLSGYPRLHLSCSALSSVTTSGQIYLQFAYAGIFTATGYSYQITYNYVGNTIFNQFSSGSDVGILISAHLPTSNTTGATIDADISFGQGTGFGGSDDVKGMTRNADSFQSSAEESVIFSGVAPVVGSAPNGVQIFPSAGTMSGMCWLTPRT